MRRKVFQDFANVFCQRVINLPDGYDLASFAHYGSGKYKANISTGECSYNGTPIPQLRLCRTYQEWLRTQFEKHGVRQDGIRAATLEVKVAVRDVNLLSSYGHRFASAHFFFECQSEIRSDEKTYVGRMDGDKEWGYNWYSQRLYGALPDVWPSVPC
jgi:hypothetical protein